ncbi:unnamed protein product [Discosporangium mesarthrocarpum]
MNVIGSSLPPVCLSRLFIKSREGSTACCWRLGWWFSGAVGRYCCSRGCNPCAAREFKCCRQEDPRCGWVLHSIHSYRYSSFMLIVYLLRITRSALEKWA